MPYTFSRYTAFVTFSYSKRIGQQIGSAQKCNRLCALIVGKCAHPCGKFLTIVIFLLFSEQKIHRNIKVIGNFLQRFSAWRIFVLFPISILILSDFAISKQLCGRHVALFQKEIQSIYKHKATSFCKKIKIFENCIDFPYFRDYNNHRSPFFGFTNNHMSGGTSAIVRFP